MPELNIDRILNENPTKVLMREYANLKSDYTKMNAIKYKSLYESASLSFILENSSCIFTEPMYGCDFYKSIMESQLIPFDMLLGEYDKVFEYTNTNLKKMSETQKEKYTALLECVKDRCDSTRNSCNLYTSMMENAEEARHYYDVMYEQKKSGNLDITPFLDLYEEYENPNIMDTVNIMMEFTDYSRELLNYMESLYVEDASSPEDYRLNEFTANVLNRMMKDKAIYERVTKLPNINLRHTIMGLSGVDGSDMITSITEKVVKATPVLESISAVDALSDLYEATENASNLSEEDIKEKTNRLLCERAVLEVDRAFLLFDSEASSDNKASRNSIVEKLCIESTEIEKIPYTITGQLELIVNEMTRIDTELSAISTDNTVVEEKYFGPGGTPNPIVARSIGRGNSDSAIGGHSSKEDGVYPRQDI